ncbi:MAG: hypothetical protein FWH55_13670, partial [Oscillospiraceae bacterium]|nr:hypothetical protein [Oscillospiraceae bacterium]
RPAPTGAISAASTYNYGDSALAMAEAGAQYNALDVEEMSFLRQGDDFDDFSINSGMIETAHGRAAGDQFEFTVKTPVSIVRRQSAMLPLVEGAVHAEKMLVFSSRKTPAGNPANPAIGAKLVNNTGMKLPAGPITVYDGGTYAGDALIAFFPEGETRIISYGEDLSVTGSFTDLHSTKFSAASVKGGVMAVRQQRSDERVYRFRNASGETKRLVVEHPFRKQPAKLVTPTDYIEKTSDLYRFELFIPPGELTFSVIEEEPIIRNVILSKIPRDEFIYYSTNQDYPEAVRSALLRAIELKQSIDAEKEKLDDIQNRLKRLFDEQNRTRKNLEAAGPQTQQGQNYLSRLAAQDNDIDELNKAISDSEKALKSAQRTYDEYIQDMCFAEEGICFGV